MKIKEVMRSNVQKADVNECVAAAVQRMSQKKVDSLVVTNGDKLVGIITGEDLAIGCLGEGHRPWDCQVFRHLSMPLVSVTTDTDAIDALKLMVGKEIRHLPVIDDDHLVGIAAMSDIVKAAIESRSAVFQ